jgi:hypothetical protein
LTYLLLSLLVLAGMLGSLLWYGHLASTAAEKPMLISHAPESQVIEYQVIPASVAPPRSDQGPLTEATRPVGVHLILYTRVATRPVGVHLILYTRVEADAQGNPVLRGYRLRVTWDEPPVPDLGISGSPLPQRDMASPY